MVRLSLEFEVIRWKFTETSPESQPEQELARRDQWHQVSIWSDPLIQELALIRLSRRAKYT
jgi:hypothetical protein